MKPRFLAVGAVLAALMGLSGSARGQEFISAGSPVILELPLENEDTSTTTAQGARIVATFEEVTPAGLSSYLSIDEAGSTLGPLAIPVGAANAKTFRVRVVLADGAPDGSFKVRLHPTVENADLFMSPDPETLDTSVPFTVDSTPPTLWVTDGAGKVINDAGDTQNGLIKISATPSFLNGYSIFNDTDYETPISIAPPGSDYHYFTPIPDTWYWARACDAAGNCVKSSFVLIPPDGNKPPGPGQGPTGPRQPPHPPQTLVPPCLIEGVISCVYPPNVPNGPDIPFPPGWPPVADYPPIPFLVPGDPNSLHGPEGSVTPGQLMTYTVMFENVGDGQALGVFVKDVLDPSLDDSILTVRDMYTHSFVDDVPISTTPANFPWSYHPQTRTVTVLTGNAGPNNGGSFVIETRLKSSSPPGTVVSNQALIYFPNALQTITPTNTVISAVPLATQLSYVGVSTGAFLDTAALAANLTTSNGPAARQSVGFQLAGFSANARTDQAGRAATSVFLSTAAGSYNVSMNYPGDNFFYLPTAASVPFTLAKRPVQLQAPYAAARPTDTVHLVLTLTDDQAQALQRQAEEPKTVVLEALDASGAAVPLGASLLSGTTVTFQFAVPQPLRLSWPLRARFDGDSRYAALISTGVLNLRDDQAPEIVIRSPRGGEAFAPSNIITIDFSIHDNADPAPSAAAYLEALDGSQFVSLSSLTSVSAGSLSPGAWVLRVSGQDWAGNIASTSTPSFQVVSDNTSPHTTLVAGSPSFGAEPIYVSSQTSIFLSAADDRTTVGDGIGVGVAQTRYSVDSGAYAVYIGPFSLADAGPHTVAYFSVDLAGNTETAQTKNLYVDAATPVTSLLNNGLATSATNLALLPTDVLGFSSSDAGSGVFQTLYTVDNSTEAVFVSTFSLAAGIHVLAYRSLDLTGNAETPRAVAINVMGPSSDNTRRRWCASTSQAQARSAWQGRWEGSSTSAARCRI